MSNYGPDDYDERDPDRTQHLPQGRPPYRDDRGYAEPARGTERDWPDDRRGYSPEPRRSGIGGGVLTGAIAVALVVGGVVGFLLSASTSSNDDSNAGPGSTATVTRDGTASTVTGEGSTSTTTVTGDPSTTTETSTTTTTTTTTVTQAPEPTQ